MEQEAYMSNYKEAQAHIEDCHIIIDLQQEELEELREQVKVLKAQIQRSMNAQKVDYGVA